jgi:hypothetical protein
MMVGKWQDYELTKKAQEALVEKKRDRAYDVEFLMPHEFLFLLCNSINRLDTIVRLHSRDLKSELDNIYQWELSEGKSIKVMQELGQVMHIHKLKKDAFQDKAPHVMVARQLNQDLGGKRIEVVE